MNPAGDDSPRLRLALEALRSIIRACQEAGSGGLVDADEIESLAQEGLWSTVRAGGET